MRPCRNWQKQNAPLSPVRDKGANLCGTTLIAAACRGPSKAGNGASRSRLLPQGGFGGTLGGDLPSPSLSALHQNGGSLRRGGDGTRPLLGVLRSKRYSETRNNVSPSILPVKCPSVKGVYLISHDKRMNDCLPPILFSAIFKLLKVLPDTELDAC